MGLLEEWNKNKFSVYKSEEKTVLKLLEKLGNWVEELLKVTDKKTDLYGDHKGSWQGVRKPTLTVEGSNTIIEQMRGVIQVNLLEYSDYSIDGDWSTAIEKLISENPKALIYIPSGLYNFSKTINLNYQNSLYLDYNAEIRAISPMECFIKSHSDISNLTRVDKNPSIIYGNGKINCNAKANIGLSLGGYRGFYYNGLKMVDYLVKGVITKGANTEYAVELNMTNCYFEISNNLTNINAIAIDVNSTDNHFDNIIIVDNFKGIQCSGYSNKFHLIHVWNRDRIQDKDIGYIGFDVTGEDNLFDTCYGDTCNTSFKTVHGNTFINCDVFNSQYFRAKNTIGFDIVGTPTKPLTLINCKVKGDSSNATIGKAINGTINELVSILNCSNGFNVTKGFPSNPSLGAEKFWGTNMDLKGNINTETQTIRDYLNVKNVYSSGKVQAPYYEFGSINKKLEVNNDYIPLCNGRHIPVYHNYKPTSTTSPGVKGQMYIDTTGFYIYFENDGWLQIDRSILKTF